MGDSLQGTLLVFAVEPPAVIVAACLRCGDFQWTYNVFSGIRMLRFFYRHYALTSKSDNNLSRQVIVAATTYLFPLFSMVRIVVPFGFFPQLPEKLPALQEALCSGIDR